MTTQSRLNFLQCMTLLAFAHFALQTYTFPVEREKNNALVLALIAYWFPNPVQTLGEGGNK